MLQVEEARGRILAAIEPLASETVPLREAAGRVLANDVTAPIDLPPFDNSAMDGYAIRSTDLSKAAVPVSLRVIERLPAGARSNAALEEGTCARVFTGSQLPEGADAVVMQEDVRTEGDKVVFTEAVKPSENIRFRGEDIKLGQAVAEGGDRIAWGMIGLLGALGIAAVEVARRPTVGLIATGNELRNSYGGSPGAKLTAGEIYESNRAMLGTLIEAAGGLPRVYPLVPDDLETTRRALEIALRECDAVVTSGGVSVGELDFVKEAFSKLGGKLEFWRIAMKPGKPFVFGRHAGKLLFGLPGNPVSAAVTALLLVRPAILRFQGARNCDLPGHPGMAAEALVNRGDRRHFMRVRVDATGAVQLAGTQASHMLGSLAAANGLVDVAPNTTMQKGERIQVLRFDL
jgi:molybdopterin molybdotransferase